MHLFIHLSIGFWLSTGLQCRSSMSSNCLVFHTSRGISSSPAAFLFLIFLSSESSSSRVNSPNLMSNCLLIILVIGAWVTFGGFPSRFRKFCFYCFIRSCWFVAFSLALAVLFLLLTSFIFCHALLDCLYSTESLILFCLYSVCSFRYMLANSFYAAFILRTFVLVWFFQLHLEGVFTSARFSLTANVSHGTLDVVLCFVGMYFAAAFWWALTKFSYFSFEVRVSVSPCSASNFFLNAIAYVSLLLIWRQIKAKL